MCVCVFSSHLFWTSSSLDVVVVVVVFFTLTDRSSTIPSNIRGCQSGTWSQRGTKVNGSHHGDNPLLRPIGIQIATKVMRLYKRWHRPMTKRLIKHPLLHTESSLDRLGLLSPTHDQRPQQKIGQIRTSRGHTGGRSHRISHPPSFYGACLNYSREKDSAIPFPR